MHCFNLYTLLQMHSTPLLNAIMTEDDIIAETDPTLTWIAHVLPNQQYHFHGPHPIHNHFLKGILSAEAKAAFQVMITPDQKSSTLHNLQCRYSLPDFTVIFMEYINKMLQHDLTTSWNSQRDSVQMWNKFHIQLVSTFQSQVIMPSQITQAYPPSEVFPLGNCDAVFVQLSESNGVKNHAQRRERLTQRGLASAHMLCPLPEYVSFISEEVQ
ncbi:uncharacterized protein BJ212DRAFT_1264438 [Suillus subaureus]|uniref:DUF6830 domain-containing protein n=1 Tax=Suillus subaureus TaxID=48587 RepID=A0A9P7EHE5_9AGAM|nr:uncharacterized protein BJ212DRAFT_1264438 [Suillus subaureus]KAG1821943.1 hypothetical protein BJ212DRAFT_1264438 [Suillus subaureus]